MKLILGTLLGGLAGAFAYHFGGWGGVMSAVIAQMGMAIMLIE